MFDANDFKYLDPKYFNIIAANEYDVTVMSRNTGHPIRTTIAAGRAPCGRRCGVFRDMTSGK